MAALTAFGIGLDQASKALVLSRLEPGRPIPLLDDWFQLRLYRNPGAAFSLGEDFTVVFAGLAIVVFAAAAGWAVRRVRSRWWAVLTGLGLAGVAGNLIDRLAQPPGPFRGAVIDFLYVRGFATFNVADVCLTTAAGCLILAVLRGWSETGRLRLPADPQLALSASAARPETGSAGFTGSEETAGFGPDGGEAGRSASKTAEPADGELGGGGAGGPL
jgi:signal peptidase II